MTQAPSHPAGGFFVAGVSEKRHVPIILPFGRNRDWHRINPATTGATLTGAVPGTVVTVFDALGRPVTSATADAAGTAALVLPAGLPTGVYVVRAGNKARRLTVE